MTKTASSNKETLQLTVLLGDFRLLLILFVAFRVLFALTYQPLLFSTGERGITTGGDFLTYFQLGELTETGLLPFRDWWSEFPPIPSYLITLIYQVSGGNYSSFAFVLGSLFLACDVGVLVLLRKIATHLYNPNMGMSIAWVYALFFAPTVMIWWNFEILVTLFLLLGLWFALKRQDHVSALWAGVGALVKFTPAILLAPIWRFRARNRAIVYTAIITVVFGLVYGLLLLQNAEMTLPSLVAQFGKASYQTVWALIDGNYRTGNFGAVIERLDPAFASVLIGNPAVIPSFVRLGIALAVGLFVFLRVRRFDDRGFVAFLLISLLIFFLQAQGWSPQWIIQIIPLALLCFPTRQGILSLVLLTAAVFVEYPYLFLRTAETNGVISGELLMPFTALVLGRTALLIGFCFALYQKLRQESL